MIRKYLEAATAEQVIVEVLNGKCDCEHLKHVGGVISFVVPGASGSIGNHA